MNYFKLPATRQYTGALASVKRVSAAKALTLDSAGRPDIVSVQLPCVGKVSQGNPWAWRYFAQC
jgi:hypothetical protein